MYSCHVCLEGAAKKIQSKLEIPQGLLQLNLYPQFGILIPFSRIPLETGDVSCFFLLSQLPPLTLSLRVPFFLRLTPKWNASSLLYPHSPQQAAKPPYKGTGRT